MSNQTATATPRDRVLLILSWLWVGIPLAWGVWETLVKSRALFQ
jgi:hypothetical protein